MQKADAVSVEPDRRTPALPESRGEHGHGSAGDGWSRSSFERSRLLTRVFWEVEGGERGGRRTFEAGSPASAQKLPPWYQESTGRVRRRMLREKRANEHGVLCWWRKSVQEDRPSRWRARTYEGRDGVGERERGESHRSRAGIGTRVGSRVTRRTFHALPRNTAPDSRGALPKAFGLWKSEREVSKRRGHMHLVKKSKPRTGRNREDKH